MLLIWCRFYPWLCSALVICQAFFFWPPDVAILMWFMLDRLRSRHITMFCFILFFYYMPLWGYSLLFSPFIMTFSCFLNLFSLNVSIRFYLHLVSSLCLSHAILISFSCATLRPVDMYASSPHVHPDWMMPWLPPLWDFYNSCLALLAFFCLIFPSGFKLSVISGRINSLSQ